MARLQILELPDVERSDGTYETPFVLVIDQANGTILSSLREQASRGVDDPLAYNPVADQIGATAVLVFDETIDIPANDLTAYSETLPSPDEAAFRKDLQKWSADVNTTLARVIDAIASPRKKPRPYQPDCTGECDPETGGFTHAADCPVALDPERMKVIPEGTLADRLSVAQYEYEQAAKAFVPKPGRIDGPSLVDYMLAAIEPELSRLREGATSAARERPESQQPS